MEFRKFSSCEGKFTYGLQSSLHVGVLHMAVVVAFIVSAVPSPYPTPINLVHRSSKSGMAIRDDAYVLSVTSSWMQRRNHTQVSMLSLSMMTKSTVKMLWLPSNELAINGVTLYFPVRKVPSTTRTGEKCGNPSIHGRKLRL